MTGDRLGQVERAAQLVQRHPTAVLVVLLVLAVVWLTERVLVKNEIIRALSTELRECIPRGVGR